MVSCKDEESIIGQTGPGGGLIFYDAGGEQTSTYTDKDGNTVEYTWRYLEAAPADLSVQLSYTEAVTQCENYTTKVGSKVYDDWFLPNAFELNLMYENLAKAGMGSFKDLQYYWSRDKNKKEPESEAQAIIFKIDYTAATLSKLPQTTLCNVRPIRAYL